MELNDQKYYSELEIPKSEEIFYFEHSVYDNSQLGQFITKDNFDYILTEAEKIVCDCTVRKEKYERLSIKSWIYILGIASVISLIIFFIVLYYGPRYENGKTLNGNKQVNASDVLPEQYITKVYQNDKVVAEFKDNMPNFPNSTNSLGSKTRGSIKKSTEVIEVPMKEETINGKTYQYYIEDGEKKYFEIPESSTKVNEEMVVYGFGKKTKNKKSFK